ncbi:hypothetical protein SADUNF_Sadunf16G0032600 [Salix dunnii]|uniref:CCHC-type domain-containing protein n=1 Tax=Salix dunnii TaxID=1413687 RepID=A0A835J6R6_9ROSI|nr:hypothetical protein SADUNF_Sadunf16G0032600 [Salix dunnii]
MVGLVDGTNPAPTKTLTDGSLNPAFTSWSKKDNSVLSWLYASITEKLVSTVLNLETSKQVWDALQARFSSTSRSRVTFLKRQLQTISQGNRNCLSYIEEAKLFSDQLSAAGKLVYKQDLISYLLSGLQPQFMPFVTAFTFATRDKELSLDEFQTEILNFETLMEASNSTVTTETNLAFAAIYPKSTATRRAKTPNFTDPSRSPSSYTRSPTHIGPSTNKTNTPHPGDNRPICQICTKRGHMALDCYNRFNFSYQGRFPPSDLAAMAAEALTPPPDSTINDPATSIISDPEIPEPINSSDPSSDHHPPPSPISQNDPTTVSPPSSKRPSHINSTIDHPASTSAITHNTNRVITRSMTGNSKAKTFPDFTSLYSTRHPLQVPTLSSLNYRCITPGLRCSPSPVSFGEHERSFSEQNLQVKSCGVARGFRAVGRKYQLQVYNATKDNLKDFTGGLNDYQAISLYDCHNLVNLGAQGVMN